MTAIATTKMVHVMNSARTIFYSFTVVDPIVVQSSIVLSKARCLL
jgi:hypothetical protein